MGKKAGWPADKWQAPKRGGYQDRGGYEGYDGQSSRYWEYWSASWSPRSKGKDQPPARYDQVQVQGPSTSNTSGAPVDGLIVADPETRVMIELQKTATLSRKMDAKIRKIQEEKATKTSQWNAYTANMKARFVKQRQAYERDMERLDQEAASAMATGREAAEKARHLAVQGLPPVEEDMAPAVRDTAWDALMAEDQEAEGPLLAQTLAAAQQGRVAQQLRLRPEILQQLLGVVNAAGAVQPDGTYGAPPLLPTTAPQTAPLAVPPGLAPQPGEVRHPGPIGSVEAKPEAPVGAGSYVGEAAAVPGNPYHASPSARQTSLSPVPGKPPKPAAKGRVPVKALTRPDVVTGSRSFQDRLNEKRQHMRNIQAAQAAEAPACESSAAPAPPHMDYEEEHARPPEAHPGVIPVSLVDDDSGLD